jgi:hypothetical protein
MVLTIHKRVFIAPNQSFSVAPAGIGGAVVSGVTIAFRKALHDSVPRHMLHFIRWKNE